MYELKHVGSYGCICVGGWNLDARKSKIVALLLKGFASCPIAIPRYAVTVRIVCFGNGIGKYQSASRLHGIESAVKAPAQFARKEIGLKMRVANVDDAHACRIVSWAGKQFGLESTPRAIVVHFNQVSTLVGKCKSVNAERFGRKFR